MTPSAGVWHHIVYTYDGTNSYIYVDGVETGHSTNGTNTGVIQDTWIGGWGSGNTFQGSMDDVRVYNRALSATEVQQMYDAGLPGVGSATRDASPTSLVTNGLVGYWTFDGQNTNWNTDTTADVSGKGNTGKLINMSTTTSPVLGRFGQALSFNGTNQEVTVGKSLGYGTAATTYSLWAKINSTSEAGPFLDDGGQMSSGSGETNGMAFGVGSTDLSTAGNDLLIPFWGVSWQNTGVALGTGWKMVTVIRTSSNHATAYVNGQLVYTGTPTMNAYVNTVMTFAGQNNQTVTPYRYFPGSIDDVRIYNRALTQAEITKLYNAGAIGATIDTAPAQALSGGGLVGYWPFDGNKMNWASSLALDASGNGNNGTLVNMTTANAVMGVIGQALSFNGTNQYVSTPYVQDCTDYTISVWVKTTSLSENVIVQDRGSSGAGNSLTLGFGNDGYSSAGQLFYVLDTNNVMVGVHSSVTINDGTWHLVTGVFTGNGTVSPSDFALFIDGVKISTVTQSVNYSTIPSPPLVGSGGTIIGYHQAFGDYLSGSIDDVRIYNRALSASEVKQLYNLGR